MRLNKALHLTFSRAPDLPPIDLYLDDSATVSDHLAVER
jgi:hypothetical protein